MKYKLINTKKYPWLDCTCGERLMCAVSEVDSQTKIFFWCDCGLKLSKDINLENVTSWDNLMMSLEFEIRSLLEVDQRIVLERK